MQIIDLKLIHMHSSSQFSSAIHVIDFQKIDYFSLVMISIAEIAPITTLRFRG